jgi:hypothetical protein
MAPGLTHQTGMKCTSTGLLMGSRVHAQRAEAACDRLVLQKLFTGIHCGWKWQALSDSVDFDDELRYLHRIQLERKRTETLVLGAKNSTAWSMARLASARHVLFHASGQLLESSSQLELRAAM